jgi:PKD repeat protein
MKILTPLFSKMTRKPGAALALAGLAICLLLGASTAQAEIILNAIETTEGGVVISGGGTLNLDAWEEVSFDQTATASVAPATGRVFVAGKAGGLFFIAQYTNPSDFDGPVSFGDGTERTADRTSGDDFPFGIDPDPSGPSLSLDPSYFGAPLLGEAKYDNTTLEELGMDVGTYVWTWGSGETADSFTLNVGTEDAGNFPPDASAGGPYTGRVGEVVTFDGSNSSDLDGTIDRYEWNFGDDQRGTGPTPSHTYDAPGTYHVTLTVFDDEDVPASETTTAIIIDIDENQPVAEAGGPYFGALGAAVSFDGTGSTPPSDPGNVSYEWDFGDGRSGTGPTPSHTYREFGRYTVTLKVTEGRRFDMDSTTASIGVGNLPPNADANGPYTGRAGEAITFDGSASSDDGTIETYEWHFGDGSAPTTTTPPPFVTHTYRRPGLYNVILIVTDDAGDKDSIKTIAVISPEPEDNQAPDCSLAEPSIDTIWPPNGRFVPVEIERVLDPDGDRVSITIDSIFQDEPVFSRPDGRGVGTNTARVRAERLPRRFFGGNGRVYHIGFTADDERGGSCSGDVVVEVPRRRNRGAIDDGAVFDSTIPWGFFFR